MEQRYKFVYKNPNTMIYGITQGQFIQKKMEYINSLYTSFLFFYYVFMCLYILKKII